MNYTNITRKKSSLAAFGIIFLVGFIVAISSTYAGPPAICHPVDIGNAKSIPWGDSAFDKKRGYSKSEVIDDTVNILNNSHSALVHMETLRRATLYLDRNTKQATTLLAKLMAKTLDSETKQNANALAWFDAGYLAQCYDQLGIDTDVICGKDQGVIGYAWIKKAIAINENDAQLQFGAAMVTVLSGIKEHHEHSTRVKQLAKADSLVMKNLETHSKGIWTHAHGKGK
ncbi:MAG: hypothetical protein IH984_10840 [Planctomycetes bacterium]|nr:hypothetical protein [Planctomycetota bacterium]